jgi:HEPN domain-containing protein
MTYFETKYFQKFSFTKQQIDRFFESALRDLKIARQDKFAEVRFTYGYQALVKAGIALIAKVGGVKVRSVPGHHVKILEKMSEILKNPDVLTLGDAMRTKRNSDFYGGGESITEKEAEDYLKFVEKTLGSVRVLTK